MARLRKLRAACICPRQRRERKRCQSADGVAQDRIVLRGALFFSYTGRGAFFSFRQVRKEKNGGRITQLDICKADLFLLCCIYLQSKQTEEAVRFLSLF